MKNKIERILYSLFPRWCFNGFVIYSGSLPIEGYTEYMIGIAPLFWWEDGLFSYYHYQGCRHKFGLTILGIELCGEAEYGWLESLLS